MELYAGAHLIELEIVGRPLRLPLLIEDRRALLIDCGTRLHALDEIPTCLAKLGVETENLEWLVITHPDADHCGGAGEFARRYPNLRIACGADDRELIQSRETLCAARYAQFVRDHGITAHEISSADPEWFSDCPSGLSPFSGGETIHLGDQRTVEIWHVPGHSDGHLAVYDRKYRTLFYGDALQGTGYQSAAGAWVLCPIYVDVVSYLSTIARIGGAQIDSIVGCHWPIRRGQKEIRTFCSESRNFVEQADALIEEHLKSNPKGATLRELCDALGGKLGRWPPSANIRLSFAFFSHLQRAISKGKAGVAQRTHPVVFRHV